MGIFKNYVFSFTKKIINYAIGDRKACLRQGARYGDQPKVNRDPLISLNQV